MCNIVKLRNLINRVEARLPDILKPWYVRNGEFYKVYNNAYHMIQTKLLVREIVKGSIEIRFKDIREEDILVAELLALLHDIGNYDIKSEHIDYFLGLQDFCRVATFTSLRRQEEDSIKIIRMLLNKGEFLELEMGVKNLLDDATEITFHLMFASGLSKEWAKYSNSSLLLGMADALQVASPTHVYDIVYFSYQKAASEHISCCDELSPEVLVSETEVVERLMTFDWEGVNYPLLIGESMVISKLLEKNFEVRQALSRFDKSNLLSRLKSSYESANPLLISRPCFSVGAKCESVDEIFSNLTL